MRLSTFAMIVGAAFAPAFAFAEGEKDESVLPIPDPVSFETEHRGTFFGENVRYQAKVSDIQLKRANGDPYTSIFTIDYVAEGVNAEKRPVMFIFGGGPGSSSTYVHMGLFGPYRVDVPSDAGYSGGGPYPVENNSLSALGVTDLVFIDPTGTGYSQRIGDGKPEDVYSIAADADTIAQVIRHWLTVNKRWNSPKFLAGQSYGTTRIGALMKPLMDNSTPVSLNGVVLLSLALDFSGSSPWGENLPSFITYLPSMAATAWYHDRVEKNGRTLEAFIDDVKTFAVEDYAAALIRGAQLTETEQRRIAEKYAAFTGLDAGYVLRSRLRVPVDRFMKELLRNPGNAISRLDTRYIADEVDDIAIRPAFDAAGAATRAPFTAAIVGHLQNRLGVTLERPYLVSGAEINANWVYHRPKEGQYREPAYVTTAADFAWAQSYDPKMKTLIASAYFDFATPFYDVEYTLSRYGIEKSRITANYYPSGHSIFLHRPSFEKLAEDIRAFVVEASAKN